MNEDEITFDEVDREGEEMDANPAILIKKLREKIKKLEQEKEEYLTGWQKERAESVNIQKRAEESKKSFAQYANEGLINDLIPTLDNFEMAMKNKEVWASLPEVWTKGVEYIYSQLVTTLESYGLKKLNPIGQTFDPKNHEALENIKTENKDDDHKVIEVVQSGYILGEKIIRPAKVKVAEHGE